MVCFHVWVLLDFPWGGCVRMGLRVGRCMVVTFDCLKVFAGLPWCFVIGFMFCCFALLCRCL